MTLARLLLLAIVSGGSLFAALGILLSSDPAGPPTRARVGVAAALLAAGLGTAVVGTHLLALELDSGLLASFGLFLVFLGLVRIDRPGAATFPSAAPMTWRGHVALVCIGVGLVIVASRRTSGIIQAIDECRTRYGMALRSSDTVAVDRLIPTGSPHPVSRYGTVSDCGDYRARQYRP